MQGIKKCYVFQNWQCTLEAMTHRSYGTSRVLELKLFIPYSEIQKLTTYIDSNYNKLFTMIASIFFESSQLVVDSNANVHFNIKQWVLLMILNLWTPTCVGLWSIGEIHKDAFNSHSALRDRQLFRTRKYLWKHKKTPKSKELADFKPNSFQAL